MTLSAANNYAVSLNQAGRYKEVKALLRRTTPVARRVVGESSDTTLRMRLNYAEALCSTAGATLDDLRESVATFEEIEQTSRRVFGGAHPFTVGVGRDLRTSRTVLAAREGTPPGNARP